VNTADEVPDSSWFTNRIGARPMTTAEIVRGPDRVDQLTIGDWVIIEGKETGRQAGFRAVSASDPSRQVYQIEFDPTRHPEMATGAEIIGTAIYHALGYNVVDVYLTEIDKTTLTIAPSATIEVGGRKRRFTRHDLDAILRRAARQADGRYRATASRFADGRNLGPFRYYGTRPDDPNDIYPHEHRRELRANRVFCAWLNHDDSRAVNSLDMLVGSAGHQWVKHYMFDFGSILGSGTNDADHPWVGHEYVIEPRPAVFTLLSMGLWKRPFLSVQAPPQLPALGGFTADGFVPDRWKPHYPNPAFRNMRPEDAFWGARLVAAFTPEAIAGIVQKARFSDPRVTDSVTGTLLRRRARILETWLTAVNPLAGARIDGDRLFFTNVAEEAGVVDASSTYEVAWFRFDNATGQRGYVSHPQLERQAAAAVPAAALGGSAYAGVEIRTSHRDRGQWHAPVRFYFKADGRSWQLVGLERDAETLDGLRAAR
jgi:hypothetical protein